MRLSWKPPLHCKTRHALGCSAIPTRLLTNQPVSGNPQPQTKGAWPYGSWTEPSDSQNTQGQQQNGSYVSTNGHNGQYTPNGPQYVDQQNGYDAQPFVNGNGQHTNGYSTQQPLYTQAMTAQTPSSEYTSRQPHFAPPMYQPAVQQQETAAAPEAALRNYPPYYGKPAEGPPAPVNSYYDTGPLEGGPQGYPPGLPNYGYSGIEPPPFTSTLTGSTFEMQQYGEPAYTEDNVLLVRGMETNALVEHPGSVVVVGDVGPGSKVVAGGSVFVWGRLQGTAHAGAFGGAPDPMVVAAEMQPQELQIGALAAYPPEQSPGLPVVALLDDNGANIELDRTKKIYTPKGLNLSDGSILTRFAHTTTAVPFGATLHGSSTLSDGSLSGAGRAALVTGLYITVAGLMLLLRPQLLYTLFDASGVSPGWIRVGGTLCTLFGSYYCGAAFGESAGIGLGGFYIATTAGRLFLAAVFALLVAAGQVGPGLLLLAAVNLWGAWNMARNITAV